MNSATGRFASFDTYEGQSNEPLTLHKFLYSGANPVNRSDPSGHFTSLIDVMAAGIIRTGLANITSLQGHAIMDQLIHGGNAGLKSLVANGLFMMGLGLLGFAKIPGRFQGSSSRAISASADALEGALFRGTSEGWAGGPVAVRHGLTSTTTNPVIAHMFAAESATQGSPGVIYIALESDLAGVEVGPGNVLSAMEREIVLELQPTEFASRASIKLTTEQSQMILRERGIEVPSRIHGKSNLDQFIREVPMMTPLDVTLYLRRAIEITQ